MKGWRKTKHWFLLASVLSILLAMPAAGEITATPTPSPPESSFTVLCYHRFITHPEGKKTPSSVYFMPVDEFRWQMKYLKDHQITPISLDQLKAYWFEGKPLPEKAVLLTFDDGFDSIYKKAYPVLKEFGYPGVLFIITDFTQRGDSPNYWKLKRKKNEELALSHAEIQEMQKNGFAVESHTKSHSHLGKDEEKNKPDDYQKFVEKELKDPLQYLQEKFGNRPTVLAYPYGDFNQTVLKQTKEAGYALAFTVNPGPNDRTVPSLKLRRNLVLYPLGHKGFEKMFESRVLHLGNLSPDDGEVISSHKPLLKVQVKDEIDPKTIDLQLGDHQTNFQYDPKTHLLQHGFEVSLKAGGHMLMLAATDLHGQKRVYTWFFRIKYKHLTKEKEEK